MALNIQTIYGFPKGSGNIAVAVLMKCTVCHSLVLVLFIFTSLIPGWDNCIVTVIIIVTNALE